MNHFYSDVIHFKGKHYDFGYMQGELLKASSTLHNREKQRASRRKHQFNTNTQEAIDLFSKFMPRMLDELQGLADSLNWSIAKSLTEFGGYYVEYERSGCSILTGSEFMVRNYDSHPAYYEGRYVIYDPTDTGYATIGPSMQITGRTDGMNEKGLAMGYNFVNRVGSGDGFVCNMIGRMILETCANVDEAISLLKEIPHRTLFNYILLDPKGETFVVETSPRKVAARKSNISTNHFEVLTDHNRYRMDDSLRRTKKLESQQNNDLSAFEAYQLLNDQEKEIFSSKYDASAGTIHTTAYLPKEMKALFAIGGNRMPVIFDFQRHLAGETTNIKQIKGKLNYHKPFVNMERSVD
jgi:predicted choloylglycine hydrolase